MSKAYAKALVSKGLWSGRTKNVVAVLGQGLRDEREEMFVILVCDGLPMGLAFRRAGFTSKDAAAPHALLALPRVQERAQAILAARRTTGVVTLPEVTDMLKRVFAGAQSAEEYSAAHNAAFSLARLYGHVTDKATLEVIRRPSRDPDAPAEQMLEAWAASLPGPVVEHDEPSPAAVEGPLRSAPAPLLGPEPRASINDIIQPEGPSPDGWREIENGAPTRPVTGTPHTCGGSELLEKETGSPFSDEGTRIPSFKELFGE